MRLIDADAFSAEMRRKQDNCRTWKDSLDEGTELYARAEQSFITFVEAALTLKGQPTIDAIPIEIAAKKLQRAFHSESWEAWATWLKYGMEEEQGRVR